MMDRLRKQGLFVIPAILLLGAAVLPQLPGRAIVAEGAAHVEAGELDEAVSGLTLTRPSAAALYDLGVAWFKKGDAVHALGAFRAASEIAPRDGDIAHNLAVARLAFPDAPAPAGHAVPWAALVTPGELGLLAIVTWFVSGALVRRWRSAQDGLAGALGAVGVSALLTAPATFGHVAQDGTAPAVLQSPAALRGAPEITERVLANLPVGSELRIDALTADFARVEDGQGRRGWVPRAALYTATLDAAATRP